MPHVTIPAGKEAQAYALRELPSSALAEAWYCSSSMSRTNANSSRLTVGLRRCAWDTACWT